MIKLCIKQLLHQSYLFVPVFYWNLFLINYYLYECQVGFIIKAEVDPQNMIYTQNLLTLFMHFARFGFGPQLKLEGGHHLFIIKSVIFIIILNDNKYFLLKSYIILMVVRFCHSKRGRKSFLKRYQHQRYPPIQLNVVFIESFYL